MITRIPSQKHANCLCCGAIYILSTELHTQKDGAYWNCDSCNAKENLILIRVYQGKMEGYSVKAGKRHRQIKKKAETVAARAAY